MTQPYQLRSGGMLSGCSKLHIQLTLKKKCMKQLENETLLAPALYIQDIERAAEGTDTATSKGDEAL